MSTLTPFDVTADLPTGTVLLEASAGTGKTWTIGALVARYIADGTPLEEMLVITFGRAASREMRERVRGHLRHVHQHLVDPDLTSDDPVVALLRDGSPDEVALKERRLRDALTHFDAATIATTHQFCQLVLRGLGVAGDSDPHSRLVEDLSDLRDEVVDDLYVRGFAGGGTPAFTRARAGEIARAVTENPHATLDPHTRDDGSADARMLGFAHLVRTEMDRRKRRLGVLGYDDLLSHLASALEAEDSPARERMRQRWKVVLVDEFQDTDPVQWQVLDRAFTGHSTLVLIGDPKQAIYGFRGGDVDTYLTASATATTKHTLGVNHRSDGPLVRSLGVLLGGSQLGDPEIVVHPVSAAKGGSRLGTRERTAPEGMLAPVRLRAITTERILPPGEKSVAISAVRPLVADDCAAEITRLLARGTTFDARPLRAGDVAVLAHTRSQLDHVRRALTAVGLRSVIVSSDSIYASPAAAAWLTLLEAMELSHRPERVRAAALTPFVGANAATLDERGHDLTEEVAHRMRTWAGLLSRRGVAAVLAAASADGLDARVLSRTDGERLLTDLRHVGETLHQRVVTEGDGLASLTAWLRERIGATRKEERARRLDSDADAVHLATIHSSKGLQYPIVMLPFVADRWLPTPDVLHFHREDRTRCLDIGIRSDEGRADRLTRAADEESGESLRLLYVAMTRAQSQVVTWWFPSAKNTAPSPLHRVLLGRREGQGEVPASHPVPGDETLMDRLEEWERRGALRVELVDEAAPMTIEAAAPVTDLSVRSFTRSVDTQWRRTSYTALTRPLDEAPRPAEELVVSEPEVTERQDDEGGARGRDGTAPMLRPGELQGDVPLAAVRGDAPDDDEGGHLPSPMAELPVGAGFGSLVHAVLEEADVSAPDLLTQLRAHVEEQVVHWPVPDLDRDTLAEALVEVIDTPLGPLAPGTSLRDIGSSDRLCEMDFELPLGGGDDAGDAVDQALLGDLATLMREHLPEGDPVLPFADVLEDPLLGGQALRGYLTGSVDIVLRVGGRHLVVDYKSNWLGPADTPLTTGHYEPDALREAMNHSSYPLQAILYGVVLHRFLRWRQPGYDPQEHFGGVLYLYLRGMAGTQTPIVDGHPTGVFSWQPPIALVEALSDLLDGRRPATTDAPREHGTQEAR
ncbi:UvrD-helicase domain-containing protein [Janibacter cremeus]|uniref:RecBCD enzyme subunit RecB n=1 Tax=Janibacter cremeus TaxID=1285192 RepID=A0A852VVS2_9MICO|nr:UvrD-helicase domain-containing protein [Janibacter cremeus]NYF98384.1 exodeoxyribonuclease V beta subunit [Janibacter cremeus]